MKKKSWKILAVGSVQRNWPLLWDQAVLVNQLYWIFYPVTSKYSFIYHITDIEKEINDIMINRYKGLLLSSCTFSIYDPMNQSLNVEKMKNIRNLLLLTQRLISEAYFAILLHSYFSTYFYSEKQVNSNSLFSNEEKMIRSLITVENSKTLLKLLNLAEHRKK